MRLAITFLGLDLFSIDVTTDAPSPAPDEYEDPGESTTYPVGFTATHEIPDQAGPYREGWE